MLNFNLNEKLICRMVFILLRIFRFWFIRIDIKFFRILYFFLIVRIIEFILENWEKF